MIKAINKLEEVIEFAWELSKSNLHASYPRIEAKNRLERELKKAFNAANDKVIVCYNQNVLCGLCSYFWLEEEKYAQTTLFLIRENYDQIADELIDYISKQLVGYEILIGVPFTNGAANQYFKKKNIECIESSIVTNLYNLEAPLSQRHNDIERVTKDNFDEYAIFHDKHALPIGMYFNSQNLKKAIERFQVFAFRREGIIRGSIFTNANKHLSDVVGLFVDAEYKNTGIESILINEMLVQLYNEFGSVKEILFFVDENSKEELALVLEAGFKIKEAYRCYKVRL
jgi:ribosomal protein S18 acetylase RimI-like enzyme